MATVSELYATDTRRPTHFVQVGSQVLPVREIEYEFGVGRVPTAILRLADLANAFDVVSMFHQPVHIHTGFNNIMQRVFTGRVTDYGDSEGLREIHCEGESAALAFQHRDTLIEFDGVQASAAVISLLVAAKIAAYSVVIAAWNLGGVSLSEDPENALPKLEFGSYGDAIKAIVEPDGGEWFEMPDGVIRVRDIYVLDNLTTGSPAKVYQADDVGGRLFTYRIQPNVRETKNQAIVRGNNVPLENPDGTTDSIEIDGRADAESIYVLDNEGQQAFSDVLFGSHLVDTPEKAGEVAGRIVNFENGLHSTVTINVAYDPTLHLLQNVGVEDNRRGIEIPVAAVMGYRCKLTDSEAISDVELLALDNQDNAEIFPFALYTQDIEREAMGDGVITMVSLRGDLSVVFGTAEIDTVEWFDNQDPKQIDESGGAELLNITRKIDPNIIDDPYQLTLRITDTNGKADELTKTLFFEETSEGVIVPTLWVANDVAMSISLNGGPNWDDVDIDVPGDSVISGNTAPPISSAVLTYGLSVGVWGTQNGRIIQTINGEIVSTVQLTPASPVMAIWFDLKDYDVVWAICRDGQLYRNNILGGGLGWFLWDDLKQVFGVATSVSTGIATPLVGGVWIFGGGGTPLIALDPFKDHNWMTINIGGELLADLANAASGGLQADAIITMRIPAAGAQAILRHFAGGDWVQQGTVPDVVNNTRPDALKLSERNGVFLRLRSTEIGPTVRGNSAQGFHLERSLDDGATWTPIGPPAILETIVLPGTDADIIMEIRDYTWAPDGSIWVTRGLHLTADGQAPNVNTQTQTAASILHCADPGGAAVFTTEYTDAGVAYPDLHGGNLRGQLINAICVSDDGQDILVQGSFIADVPGLADFLHLTTHNWFSTNAGGSFARRDQTEVTMPSGYSDTHAFTTNALVGALMEVGSGRFMLAGTRTATGPTTIHLSDDVGETWYNVTVDASAALRDAATQRVHCTPYNRRRDWGGRMVLAFAVATGPGSTDRIVRLWRSDDNCLTWTLLPTQPNVGLQPLAFDYDFARDRILYVQTASSTLVGPLASIITSAFGATPIVTDISGTLNAQTSVEGDENRKGVLLPGAFSTDAYIAGAAGLEIGEMAIMLHQNLGTLLYSAYYTQQLLGDGSAWTRALAQPQRGDGAWIAPDSIPGQFVFGYEGTNLIYLGDVFGGIMTASVAPAAMDTGDHGNECVALAGMLGGLGFGGIYMIAAEGPIDGTLYKTFDRFATIGKIRPSALVPSVPAGANGKFIGIGIRQPGMTSGDDGSGDPPPDPGDPTPPPIPPAGTRSKLLWPFAAESIWNQSIGSGAVYVHAGLEPRDILSLDPEYFIRENAAFPEVDLWINGNFSPDRCEEAGFILDQVRIDPTLDIQDTTPGYIPNNAAALLRLDGDFGEDTLTHLLPVTRCLPQTSLTAGFRVTGETDIKGDGLFGAHGGSFISALGGQIRSGELTSGEPIRHAIKLNISQQLMSKQFGGFRWPAFTADTGFEGPGGAEYTGTVPQCRMGALLAIRPQDYDALLAVMHSNPARKLLWTLRHFGTYIVDTAFQTDDFSSYNWNMDPVVVGEFETATGFDFEVNASSSGDELDWYEDNMLLFESLYVVNNNGPSNIGGGGIASQPPPPPFSD